MGETSHSRFIGSEGASPGPVVLSLELKDAQIRALCGSLIREGVRAVRTQPVGHISTLLLHRHGSPVAGGILDVSEILIIRHRPRLIQRTVLELLAIDGIPKDDVISVVE
jgi:hypothetical protein